MIGQAVFSQRSVSGLWKDVAGETGETAQVAFVTRNQTFVGARRGRHHRGAEYSPALKVPTP